MAALVSAVLGAAVAAVPAQASGLTYTVTNYDHDGTHGVYLRNSANLNDVVRDGAHYVTYGTSAQLVCYAWGTAVGSYANKIWHNVKILDGSNAGRTGWLSDHWLNTPVTANHPVPGEPQCGSGGSPPPSSGSYMNTGERVRFCIDLSVSGCGTTLTGIATPAIATNRGVTMVCWQDGSNFAVGSVTSPRWFWVRSGSSEGFVPAPAVSRQTTVGVCSNNKPIWAAETAVQRYGETYVQHPADQGLFAGWNGEWAGDCPKLPYVGWHAAGVDIRRNDAIKNYDYYNAAGQIHHVTSAPPVGAVAFFDVSEYGHEALSLGDGLLVSTSGVDTYGTPNVVRTYTHWGTTKYLGWMMP